jgi:hypothetical protein
MKAKHLGRATVIAIIEGIASTSATAVIIVI